MKPTISYDGYYGWSKTARMPEFMDGQEFYMLVDQTNNTKIADCTFDDIAPRQCRYVRLTITGWPEGINLGIIEATVFGRYSGYINPVNPQENDRYLYNY